MIYDTYESSCVWCLLQYGYTKSSFSIKQEKKPRFTITDELHTRRVKKKNYDFLGFSLFMFDKRFYDKKKNNNYHYAR